MSLRGFGFCFDIKTGVTRSWYVDSAGVKRWVQDDTIVDQTDNTSQKGGHEELSN
jgi:hypothetical protein